MGAVVRVGNEPQTIRWRLSIVLIVGSMAHDVEDAWSSFLRDALKTTPARMAARLSATDPGAGVQSSAFSARLWRTLHAPKRSAVKASTTTTRRLNLCRVRLLYFDYDKTPSRSMHERSTTVSASFVPEMPPMAHGSGS